MRSGGPVTVMVMSLSEDAAIVRLYGEASVEPIESSPLAERLLAQCRDRKGLRQVVTVSIAHTQTSCGYGVPVLSYAGERTREQRGRRYK